MRRLHDLGVEALNGWRLYFISEEEYAYAFQWFESIGLQPHIEQCATSYTDGTVADPGAVLDAAATRLMDAWHAQAGLKTYGQAVADVMEFRSNEGEEFPMTLDEWRAFAGCSSFNASWKKAKDMGIHTIWDPDHPKTPEGYSRIQGGMEFAIAKSLAVAPFADLIWMETKTANLEDAKKFAEAIHAYFPDKMLAYNLSPSFNWDTTGMSDDEMRQFPRELGRLGYVFNFITYGGHQVDGQASEEFALALQEEGMLALAQLQRKLRLVQSPYKTPQSLVGGPRVDGALMASSGRTATTKAMGKGSTQFQHLVQTEVPIDVLAGWVARWSEHHGITEPLRIKLAPRRAGSTLLELSLRTKSGERAANMVFTTIQDRKDQTILSVRDQNNFVEEYKRKRLIALLHLFLIHRYDAESVHYVSPTDDNQGSIIVAAVNEAHVALFLDESSGDLDKLITKQD